MKTLGLIVLCFILSSCATKKLWEKDYYYDDLYGFAVSEGADNVVIMGEKYHYMVRSKELKELLLSGNSRYFEVELAEFQYNGNRVYGKVNFTTDKETVEAKGIGNFLKKLRFVDSGQKVSLSLAIDGTRYEVMENVKGLEKFTKHYRVKVVRNSSLAFTGKLLVSPFAIALDGALIPIMVDVVKGTTVALIGMCTFFRITGNAGGACGY